MEITPQFMQHLAQLSELKFAEAHLNPLEKYAVHLNAIMEHVEQLKTLTGQWEEGSGSIPLSFYTSDEMTLREDHFRETHLQKSILKNGHKVDKMQFCSPSFGDHES